MTATTKKLAGWSAALCLCVGLGLVGCGLTPTPFNAEPAKSSNSQSVAEQTKQTDTTGSVATPKESVSAENEALVVGFAEDAATESGAYGYMPQEQNTEEYAKVEESGFVSTVASPLSTVSADVDTASYANLRRMLLEGYRVQTASERTAGKETGNDPDGSTSSAAPWSASSYDVIPTGAVRIEEMVNYFNYDYPKPDAKDGFAMNAQVSTCPWNKDTELLVLGYSTAAEDARVREKGANLVFLIDVSGSMDNPDKLPLLQSAFGELVEDLGENDRVSIVTYSGQEQVVLDGASGADHRQIMQAVRSLKASGSTNGEAGLRTAYEIAEKHLVKGGVNRIVMASDGDLNVGMTSESDLHDFVAKKRESGVYLSVLGFGAGNYKDTKMETLADHGNGSYHYIDSESEAKRVFGERLTANLVPFANDVKVQVEFNPAKVKGYRLIGYENRTMAAEDFKDDKKDAGEVGPESQFSVLYEVVPVDSPMEVPTPELKYSQQSQEQREGAGEEWLTAKLRYKPLGKDESKEQSLTVSTGDWTNSPNDDWKFAAAVTEFGMLLRDSAYKGTATYDTVRELVGKTEDAARVEFLDLVDRAQHNA